MMMSPWAALLNAMTTLESAGNQNKNAVQHSRGANGVCGKKPAEAWTIRSVCSSSKDIHLPTSNRAGPFNAQPLLESLSKGFAERIGLGRHCQSVGQLFLFVTCMAFGNSCNGYFLMESKLMISDCNNDIKVAATTSSSISIVSSTSSESDRAMTIGGGDLEADADSLASKSSALSSI